jgi:malonyl-CoA O-methyltransferase
VLDVETLILTYPSLEGLLEELRRNGAACAAPDRRHGLTACSVWRTVEKRYLELAVEDRLPATFEVIYGHAWKAPLPKKAGEIPSPAIPLRAAEPFG